MLHEKGDKDELAHSENISHFFGEGQCCETCLRVFLDKEATFGHVDTVEELTDILVFD